MCEVHMKIHHDNTVSLEEQAATAVRLGRELSQMAAAVYAGGNTHDHTFVKRTLQRLGEREPFDSRDDASLRALPGIVEADLKSEIAGYGASSSRRILTKTANMAKFVTFRTTLIADGSWSNSPKPSRNS